MSIIAAASVLGLGIPLLACGPFFPPSMLEGGTVELVSPPVGSFERELQRIHPKVSAHYAYSDTDADSAGISATGKADNADLLAALSERPQQERERIAAAYVKVRAELGRLANVRKHGEAPAPPLGGSDNPALPALPGIPAIPAGVPTEFALYARGAIAYQNSRMDAASREWSQLLQLPPQQRQFKTTWAAFMLGKANMKDRPNDAAAYFRMVREAKAAGFSDSLGLASSSLGWHAKIELDAKRYSKAMELYVAQMKEDDASAAWSLRDVARIVMSENSGANLTELAQNKTSRSVLNAYIVSNGGKFSEGAGEKMIAAWLAANESINARNVDDADRLAWMAYQTGKMDVAARWLERADPASPISLWIRAKLLLRKGRVKEAGDAMAKACRAFPTDEIWNDHQGEDCTDVFKPGARALAELGAICFTRHDYVQALDCLFKADYWHDAAFVAERVVSADELRQYVDKVSAENPGYELKPKEPVRSLRHLLARRLTRTGQWKEARPYYPPELRPALDAYIAGIRNGHDAKRTPSQRAQALWAAARVGRTSGMELMGTELGPDGFEYNGGYGGDRVETTLNEETAKPGSLYKNDAELKARLSESHAIPDKRYHYRYIAAEHAWDAAELMPDESDETAKVLCTAGSWLKANDPKAANRFYKALVTRCSSTPMGKEAIQTKWFPK